ncbi:tyrosine-protein phosphatase [Tannockella kyphosi]|uniref:tyrosine-protein phosphatase n=1 Tax=Tannockella kyphosi TaxID=2899121 RepID=UPI00201309EC|nr:CpsB/CapC family capsule biosynthesis tyrosine phosphatase [Tannockella kyphosi]
MIDFHSHILPGIDDGSDSIETTIQMLKESKKQGVEYMIATPHYYPMNISLQDFISNRKKAKDKVDAIMDDSMPKLLLGAEVYYYYGISSLGTDIHSLCVEGTNVLLLELPMCSFTQEHISEVIKLQNQCGLTVVLAHIERYIGFSGNKDVFMYLKEQGILFQVNATFFMNHKTRRYALSLLKQGYIDALGSDCHNMTSRNPNLLLAMNYLEKKGCLKQVLSIFNENSLILNISGK